MTPRPFDESDLRALFEKIEPPPTLEAKWRANVALADTAPDTVDAPETPQRPQTEPSPRRRIRPWLRSLGAALAAAVVGGGIIGVVAVSRQPAPDPDPDRIIQTVVPTTDTSPPPSSATSLPGTAPAGPPGSSQSAPGPAGPGTGPGGPGTGPAGTGPGAPAGPPAPARGPLTEWPDAANAGVPAGTQTTVKNGDLHVTEPGAIIADRTVNGSVYVEAPDVTLRRIVVNPPSNATVAVRQLAQAPRLRIEDSDIGNANFFLDNAIVQEAPGLVVQRSTVTGRTAAIQFTSDTTVVDCYLTGLRTRGNATRVTVRHNTIRNSIAMAEQFGPVTDVTIDNNRLNPAIGAPAGPGSHDIRVTGNQFNANGTAPNNPRWAATGWNPQAPGNIWTGNVWLDTGEPANPS